MHQHIHSIFNFNPRFVQADINLKITRPDIENKAITLDTSLHHQETLFDRIV